MTDLRKAAEMALQMFKKIHEGCEFVEEEKTIHKDAKDLATLVRKDCNKGMKALRQALAQPEQEPVAWIFESNYAASPKREWVGLEDEDVATVNNEFNRGALWAEKILKEKNV